MREKKNSDRKSEIDIEVTCEAKSEFTEPKVKLILMEKCDIITTSDPYAGPLDLNP